MNIFWTLIRNYVMILFIIFFIYNIIYDKASANSRSFRLIAILLSLMGFSFLLKHISKYIYTIYPKLDDYIQGTRPPDPDENTFGMPSGHMLIAGGIGMSLIKGKYSLLNVSIFGILLGLVYVQRVYIQHAHTHMQSLIGLLIGLLIGNTVGYKYLNNQYLPNK
jgi:hypothetical protein